MNIAANLPYVQSQTSKQANNGMKKKEYEHHHQSINHSINQRQNQEPEVDSEAGEPLFLHTVTGASTRCTLLSSTRISRARKHRALTSPSRRYSHRFSRSICSSREEFPQLACVRLVAVMLVVHCDGAVWRKGCWGESSFGITAATCCSTRTLMATISFRISNCFKRIK